MKKVIGILAEVIFVVWTSLNLMHLSISEVEEPFRTELISFFVVLLIVEVFRILWNDKDKWAMIILLQKKHLSIMI
jgi:hypothetical protein